MSKLLLALSLTMTLAYGLWFVLSGRWYVMALTMALLCSAFVAAGAVVMDSIRRENGQPIRRADA